MAGARPGCLTLMEGEMQDGWTRQYTNMHNISRVKILQACEWSEKTEWEIFQK